MTETHEITEYDIDMDLARQFDRARAVCPRQKIPVGAPKRYWQWFRSLFTVPVNERDQPTE